MDGLVKGCKGTISVYNEVGMGTSVRVPMPTRSSAKRTRCRRSRRASPEQVVPAPGRRRSGTDGDSEPDAGEVVGYEVAAFTDSAEALRGPTPPFSTCLTTPI